MVDEISAQMVGIHGSLVNGLQFRWEVVRVYLWFFCHDPVKLNAHICGSV